MYLRRCVRAGFIFATYCAPSDLNTTLSTTCAGECELQNQNQKQKKNEKTTFKWTIVKHKSLKLTSHHFAICVLINVYMPVCVCMFIFERFA